MANSALQVARTGLDAQSERMRVIANNLANVNTTGFKRDRADFETLAYQVMTAAGARSSGDNQYAVGLNLGTGVRLVGTSRITSQGSINNTENPLDLAIEGDGFFQISRPDGTTAYTRAGNFHRSNEGTLVTADGSPIQPQIQIPENAQSITIGADGTVSVTLPGQPELAEVGRLEIATFINPAGLRALGGTLYAESSASGTPQVGPPAEESRGAIRQGALEASNVNVVQELVDMIETQRAYEVNSKMVSATDEMLRNANQQL
ncbi:flagellar basal-body rod protein FlgG [Sphingosinicella sp. LHD-64]|uniref:flagellar basal-body rod protein FlgG n=1 Tax=Sphingosinicella sp. LHD-64 TaxID=3072139 RepID=UPI00280F8E16|nr:flagellar basal-body rod protein FlgG [Sphingosinicella sp. LHD-64]MDQ8757188.1 flagellar basal-body rod protein FlgG [Sphingosinicella sp. LHD-64]